MHSLYKKATLCFQIHTNRKLSQNKTIALRVGWGQKVLAIAQIRPRYVPPCIFNLLNYLVYLWNHSGFDKVRVILQKLQSVRFCKVNQKKKVARSSIMGLFGLTMSLAESQCAPLTLATKLHFEVSTISRYYRHFTKFTTQLSCFSPNHLLFLIIMPHQNNK